MAVIKRKAVSKSEGSTVKATPSALPLPTKKNKPVTDLSMFTWLVYGDKKIGKTSLTSEFEDAIIFSFEPGTKALEVYSVDIPDWSTALGYSQSLFNEAHSFKNVVIDTGKIAYDRNMQHVCAEEGMSHPSDQAYGKGWSTVGKSFEKFHLDLCGHGLGMVVVAHEKTNEIELASGLKKFVTEPDLSGSAMSFYHGFVDIIAHYHFIGTERFLTIRGNENEVAGCRMDANFLTVNGERVVRIPMGSSPKEAYQNLLKAFNNKQVDTYEFYTAKEKEVVPPKKKVIK